VAQFLGVRSEDPKGNDILRKMEPPAHDDWTKNSPNAKDTDGTPLPETSRAERELKAFIRDCLRSLVITDTVTSLRIEGLSKYLYLPGDESDEDLITGDAGGGKDNKTSERETGAETGKESPDNTWEPKPSVPVVVVKRRGKGEVGEGPDTGPGEGKGTSGEGTGGDGERQGTGQPGREGAGDDTLKILSKVKARAFASLNKNGDFEHTVILRGDPNTKCKICLKAGTDDSFDEVKVVSAVDEKGSNCNADGSFIKDISLNSAGEKKIKVIFDTKERYSLRVIAYENK
jgi:hypothetical protein